MRHQRGIARGLSNNSIVVFAELTWYAFFYCSSYIGSTWSCCFRMSFWDNGYDLGS